MGADITPTDDGMIIEGTGHLNGASIQSYLITGSQWHSRLRDLHLTVKRR